MKNIITITLFLLLVNVTSAQETKLVGSWLITSVEADGNIEHPYFITEFTADGSMVVSGMEAGTWEYNKNHHSIIMKSELDKDFNGEERILTLTKKELVIDKDGTKLFYLRIDKALVKKGNKNAGLMGIWEFKDVPYAGSNTLVTFTEPDGFTIIQKEENSEFRFSGTWIFDQQEMSLIMIGARGEDFLKGANRIVEINRETLKLESKGKTYKAKRKVQNATKIERLTFIESDFYTEDGDYKYYTDEEKLPWTNRSDLKTGLLNVKQLVYNYATQINGTEVFENRTLIADVHASLEEEGFTIDYIFNGFDSYNLPGESELAVNTDYSNPLYPLADNTFRVVGKEQVATPAGTFDCTVLEVVSDSEILKKLWMIDDKIGIYAKIIEDNPDEAFGHYSIYELQEIK